MKNVKEPTGGNQELLFDDQKYSWWSNPNLLSPSALKRLENGFEGTFQRSLLKLMPVDELGRHFSETQGRPSKELYSMAGLLLIAELRNYTIDETADAYTFDTTVQFALNLPRDGQYICPRTVDNYRKIFREDELAKDVFNDVTAALVAELDIDILKQRCDSTHVLSDMALLSRYQLIGTAAKRFLNALKKQGIELFESVDEQLRKRYEASDQRLYFGEVANPSKVTNKEKSEIIQQIGEDLLTLINSFANDEKITSLSAYSKMKRIFEEHFEFENESGKVELESSEDEGPSDNEPPSDTQSEPVIKARETSEAADGTRANTIQNSSDPDAGFCGHKGAGFQAQLAQTLPPKDEKGEVEGPGIITAVIAESAGNYDGKSLPNILAEQAANGLLPKELTADSHYGSDENVGMAKKQFEVELVSPVSGASKYPERKKPHNPKPGTHAAELKAKKQRLDQRREQQETDEWKKKYAPRSGIEGLNRALDLKTGFKKLRVRGLKAVSMCLYLKAAGWNIVSAAKIMAKRARKAAFFSSSLIFRQQITFYLLCTLLVSVCRFLSQKGWD